jgi:hypothetical protein
MLGMNAPGEWAPAFVALAACYGIAFMGVAAEWFWGRWFAIGLGWSGVMVAVFALMQLGWTPVLAIYGGIHGLVVTLLSGQKMADRFDLQTKWRERYGMDEYGVARLRKTVTRASASLPSVILWALAPKQPGQEMFAIATMVAGGLALTGLFGVIRMRAWGLLALAGAATAFVVGGVGAYPRPSTSTGWLRGAVGVSRHVGRPGAADACFWPPRWRRSSVPRSGFYAAFESEAAAPRAVVMRMA